MLGINYFAKLAPKFVNGSKHFPQTSNGLKRKFDVRIRRSIQSFSQTTFSSNLKHDSQETVRDVSEIPGPKVWPIVGCLPFFLKNPYWGTDRTDRVWTGLQETYGDIFKFKVPGVPLLVATVNPDDVEIFLKKTMDNPIREGFKSLKSVRDNSPNNYFNKKAGLLPENGEEWWRMRSRVQGPLMKPKNVAMYLPQMDKIALDFIKRIETLQSEHPEGRLPDDFLQELYKWSLESVAVVALNKELGCLDPNIKEDSQPMLLIKYINQIFKALHDCEMQSFAWRFYRTKPYVALEAAHNAFLETADRSIQDARSNLERARSANDPNIKLNILETLLQTEGLSESDVATMILDMLFAGVDTTSHTLAFALYLLATNPDCQKQLQNEIDQVLGDSETLTATHIGQMSYLNHVVRETLRLFPLVTGNGRLSTEDMVLSGYKIPKGTVIISVSSIITHNEKHFNRPNEFIPDRWRRDRPLGNIHPFASLPFSHGKRMCVGKRIAEQEIYTFLIRAMQRYSVTFESDKQMDIIVQLVIKPGVPLAFKFTKRK